MQWFRHDSMANTDAKLIKLRIKYGMEGYGLYWFCIELIANDVSAKNITFELEHDAEIIAHQTGIHHERVQEMMAYMVKLGLFEQDGGIITCFKLAKRLDERWTRSEELKQVIKKHSEKLSSDNLQIVDAIREENIIEKNRKEKEVKEKNVDALFDEFYSLYPNKKARKVARAAYGKVYQEHEQIMAGLLAYKESPDWKKDNGKFIPHPSTWLNQRRWEDELEQKPKHGLSDSALFLLQGYPG